MGQILVVWHGDRAALGDLLIALEHNECKAQLLDQRFLDGLLFARSLLPRLLDEEELFPDLLPEVSRDSVRQRMKARAV